MRLKLLKTLSFYVLILSLTSCGGYSATGGAGPTVLPRLVPRVSNAEALLNINTVLLMPLSYNDRTRDLAPNAQKYLSELRAAAAEQLGSNLIADHHAALGGFDWGRTEVGGAELRKFAHSSRADALLLTNLNNLVERQGSMLGSDQGAQVSFEMRLLRASDLREVWSASYFFEDTALSDNLFRAKERLQDRESLGWQASEQILRDGFRAALKDLSQRRQSQFVG